MATFLALYSMARRYSTRKRHPRTADSEVLYRQSPRIPKRKFKDLIYDTGYDYGQYFIYDTWHAGKWASLHHYSLVVVTVWRAPHWRSMRLLNVYRFYNHPVTEATRLNCSRNVVVRRTPAPCPEHQCGQTRDWRLLRAKEGVFTGTGTQAKIYLLHRSKCRSVYLGKETGRKV